MKSRKIEIIRACVAIACNAAALLSLAAFILPLVWWFSFATLLILPVPLWDSFEEKSYHKGKLSARNLLTIAFLILAVFSTTEYVYNEFFCAPEEYKVIGRASKAKGYDENSEFYALFDEESGDELFATSSPEETESVIAETSSEATFASADGNERPIPLGTTYVLNKNTKKFHYTDCSSVKTIKDKNFGTTDKGRDEVILGGYSPCGKCKP